MFCSVMLTLAVLVGGKLLRDWILDADVFVTQQ